MAGTAIFLLMGGISKAACHPNGGIAIYSGNVGNSPVRVALSFGEVDIPGRYAYRVSTTDIILRGTLDQSGRSLVLSEFDASGRPSATFDGTFLDADPSYAAGSKLNCEVVVGKWSSGDRILDFRLTLSSIGGSGLDHLYLPAGADSDDMVNRGASAFRTAFLKNDRNAVARMISYPIDVQVSEKRTRMGNSLALMANYDAVFTAAYLARIEKAIPRLMFARDQGIMLGDGEVWFDSKGQVIALNN